MHRLRLSAYSAAGISGYLSYSHKDRSCICSAYEKAEKKIKLRLTLPRLLGVCSATLDVYNEPCTETVCSISGSLHSSSLGLDVYTFEVGTEKLACGLYFLLPRLITAYGEMYAHGSADELRFDFDPYPSKQPQLTLCEFSHSSPEEIYGGVIYHVFVDRFARGKQGRAKDGDEIIDGEWERIPEYPAYPGAPLKNNTFYGGTLDGITKKLDYIASLGVNAIYLSPIFESPSNHRYDTADYMTVDPLLGGEPALRELIAECNRRGIKLILDGVFNHTGADSIYFNRYGRYEALGAYQSMESKFYPWFDFKSYPDKYTCWWDIEILPRINPDIPECGDYFVGEGGVIDKYRRMGIYGFRLDVADELSDEFISRIKSRLGDSSILYGEVWEDASNKIAYETRKRYYLGSELDGVMNYPLRTGLIDFVKDGKVDNLSYALREVTENAPDRIMHAQMNLLGTHDTERILTVLGGESSEGYSNAEIRDKRMTSEQRDLALRRLRIAYAALATLPGIPTIFYGDEAGLEGYHDPFNRMPYPWGKEDKDLLAFYRRLGEIRREHAVYRRGGFKLLALDSNLLIFSRKDGDKVYLTVINRSENSYTFTFSGRVRSLIDVGSSRSYTVGPVSSEIFLGKQNTTLEFEKRK